MRQQSETKHWELLLQPMAASTSSLTQLAASVEMSQSIELPVRAAC